MVSDSVRNQVQTAFQSFIGNKPAIQPLLRDLEASLEETPIQLARTYLLSGPSSCGKTTLAHRVSEVLNIPYVGLDGGSVKGPETIEHGIDSTLGAIGPKAGTHSSGIGITVYQYPPVTVFIDEAHTASRPAQKKLRELFDPDFRRASFENRVISVKATTFLLATSEPWGLDLDIRSRCTEIELRALSIAEVAEIIGLAFRHWSIQLREKIAKASRLVPRKALDLANDLNREGRSVGLPEGGSNGALDSLFEGLIRRRRIGYRGLKQEDADYLEVLSKLDRPVGLETLRILLPYGTYGDKPIKDVESYLARINAIELLKSGRRMTPEGRDCLREWKELMSTDPSNPREGK